ncbi:MAG: hypothetical protein V3T07_09525 [Myxococcota bacterium]
MIDPLAGLDTMMRVDPALIPRAGPGPSFADLLQQTARPTESPAEAAREAAARLVSSSFIMPVLTSLRESTEAAEPFAPGPVERRFAPMLDWIIADRITEAANFSLIDAIVERLGLPGATREERHDDG